MRKIRIITKSHNAFMLLDAIIGIFVCALALSLAFSFLYTLNPQPQNASYQHYLELLTSPSSTKTVQIRTNEGLNYEVLESVFSNGGESFLYYEPQALQ